MSRPVIGRSLVKSQILFFTFYYWEMDIKKIFKVARAQTNTSKEKYTDEQLIVDLNFLYQRIRRELVARDENYFWTWRKTDIKENKSEYRLEEITGTQSGMYTIKEVLLNGESLPLLSDSEAKIGKKGWQILDDHIILNWSPQEDKAQALKVVGIQTVNDLTLYDTESAIFPWHSTLRVLDEVLIMGLCAKIREGKNDFDKADRAEAKFEQRLNQVLARLTQRVQSVFYTNLEY